MAQNVSATNNQTQLNLSSYLKNPNSKEKEADLERQPITATN